MASPEQTVSLVYTPGPDCGMKSRCTFCLEGHRERLLIGLGQVETLMPDDIQRATAHVRKQGHAIRSQIFAGQSGDFFYTNDFNRDGTIREMVNGLTDSQKLTDAYGLLRICIVTNALHITKEKLGELLPYKNYLRFAFSIDVAHHNASGLCNEKIGSQLTLFNERHIWRCQYLARVKEGIDLTRVHINSPQIWVQSVFEDGEKNQVEKIAEFFKIDLNQVFSQPPCKPTKESWDSPIQKLDQNKDLVFVDKVKGNLRLYPSFPDLLSGNPSEILTH